MKVIRVHQVSPAEDIFQDVIPIPGDGEECALYAAFPRIFSTAARDELSAKEMFEARYGYTPDHIRRGHTEIFCGPIRRRKDD